MANEIKKSSTRSGLNGHGLRIAIVQSRFNPKIVSELLSACTDELNRAGVASDDIVLITVPGALEIGLTLAELSECGSFDGIIAIGSIIRGDTYHFEVVCNESARAVTEIQHNYRIPVANAILTTENEAQAVSRAKVKGKESAQVVLEMIQIMQRIRKLPAFDFYQISTTNRL